MKIKKKDIENFSRKYIKRYKLIDSVTSKSIILFGIKLKNIYFKMKK